MPKEVFVFYAATERGQAPQIVKRLGRVPYIFNKRRSTKVPAELAELLLGNPEKKIDGEKGFFEGSEETSMKKEKAANEAAAKAGEALFRKLNPKRAAEEDKARKRDDAKVAAKRKAETDAVKNAKAATAANGGTNAE